MSFQWAADAWVANAMNNKKVDEQSLFFSTDKFSLGLGSLSKKPTGMLALKPFAEAHGRSMVQAQAIPPVRLLALHGFTTHQLAYMLDSLVLVTRRDNWKPSASNLMLQFPKDKGSIHALVRQVA